MGIINFHTQGGAINCISRIEILSLWFVLLLLLQNKPFNAEPECAVWLLDCCATCSNCHQRHIFACWKHFVPQYSLLLFPPHHTHTLTHTSLMDCFLTLSPHFPSTPNPSMAHSASSASGRVAFILSIILSSPSVQFPNCSSFLLGERGKEAS